MIRKDYHHVLLIPIVRFGKISISYIPYVILFNKVTAYFFASVIWPTLLFRAWQQGFDFMVRKDLGLDDNV